MAREIGSFKSFVSEAEIDEKRKKRQEEWEKVRTAEQPQECPEEDTDMRCLYDKLQEQKDKKQEDFEEQFKFKNMVRGIDEDESKFLDEVADRQMELETRRWREENEMVAEIKKYTDRVIPVGETKKKASLKPQSAETSSTAKTGSSSTSRRSQATLLAGAVKRKRNDSEGTNGEKKTKSASSTSTNPKSPSQNQTEFQQVSSSESVTPSSSTLTVVSNTEDRPAHGVTDRARVVSILPGLGFYTNSSDSDTSSSDSEVDLLNSVIHRPSKKKSCHAS